MKDELGGKIYQRICWSVSKNLYLLNRLWQKRQKRKTHKKVCHKKKLKFEHYETNCQMQLNLKIK